MDFVILKAWSVEKLNSKIKDYINKGYKPVGSHQVVKTFKQNVFAGNMHKHSTYDLEYSISMLLEEK